MAKLDVPRPEVTVQPPQLNSRYVVQLLSSTWG